jgi:hypothetical protein
MAHRIDRPCTRLAAGWWLAAACLLAATGLLGAAAVSAEARELSGVQIGLRCETRPQVRQVSRYDFVVDRVTECRPLAFGCPTSHPEPTIPEPPGSIEVDAQESEPADLGMKSPTRADRLAEWLSGRRRLANAQYDRSVRAMTDRFRGAAR